VGLQHVHVVVSNPAGVANGVASMTLDGAPLASPHVILDPSLPGTHEVHVQLGAAVAPAITRSG
jgi:hypothetical protein